MIWISAFIFGALMGSFLNCVIHRLEVNEGFVKGRSYCPKCKKTISAVDLIPIVSFVLLKGRCRECGERISWQYPIVEAATGSLFVTVILLRGTGGLLGTLEIAYFLAIFSLMVLMFVYDLKHYLIPDEAVFAAISATIAWHGVLFISGIVSFTETVPFFLSGLGASGFFLAIFTISKGAWMGFGDVKLALFMGLFLGYPGILVALFSAFMSGAIMGSAMVLLNKKGIKSEIPFAPFLIFGTILAFFWGGPMVDWYLNLLSINALNL